MVRENCWNDLQHIAWFTNCFGTAWKEIQEEVPLWRLPWFWFMECHHTGAARLRKSKSFFEDYSKTASFLVQTTGYCVEYDLHPFCQETQDLCARSVTFTIVHLLPTRVLDLNELPWNQWVECCLVLFFFRSESSLLNIPCLSMWSGSFILHHCHHCHHCYCFWG